MSHACQWQLATAVSTARTEIICNRRHANKFNGYRGNLWVVRKLTQVGMHGLFVQPITKPMGHVQNGKQINSKAQTHSGRCLENGLRSCCILLSKRWIG